MTHRATVSLLCLVGVVVQGDVVVARLHLVAAPTKHVLPAHALTRVGVAAEGTEALSSCCIQAFSINLFFIFSHLYPNFYPANSYVFFAGF